MGMPDDKIEVEMGTPSKSSKASSGATPKLPWTKIVLLVIVMQLASMGAIAGITWAIVAHHKEVQSLATSSVMREWGLEHIRLLTVQQLRALQSVTVPMNATAQKVFQVRGLEIHTPEGSAEHSSVVLYTNTEDTLHVEMAPGANSTESTFTYEGGLTRPPFSTRVRWKVSTCTNLMGARYPLSGGRDAVNCPSTLSVTDGSTGTKKQLSIVWHLMGSQHSSSPASFQGIDVWYEPGDALALGMRGIYHPDLSGSPIVLTNQSCTSCWKIAG